MGRIATFDKKGSRFRRFGLKIVDIAAKAAKAQKLGVRDGLLGVVRVGGGKQKITANAFSILIANSKCHCVDASYMYLQTLVFITYSRYDRYCKVVYTEMCPMRGLICKLPL